MNNIITLEGEKLLAFEAGKQAGIKEVVDWIDENVGWRTDAPYKSTINPDLWKAKLKEWK